MTAIAACSGTTTVTCDTNAPNPWTTRVGTAASDDVTVIMNAGSSININANNTGNDNAISLRDRANITVNGGATVTSNATSSNGGGYNTGFNTIEFRNDGFLTIEATGIVSATGTAGNAEAVNLQGTGNLITNRGKISATNAAAIWFQNTSGLNTVVNEASGVIQRTGGNVIGGSGNGAVDFTNKGQVIGNLVFAGGNDTLRLFTGSTITGTVSGGAGTDTIYLSGAGTDSMPGSFTGFESLIKNDAGIWTLTSAVTGVGSMSVQDGTLVLEGDNSAFGGATTVDAGGTLEGTASSIPQIVSDNGLVRFAQGTDATYTGKLTGAGGLEKTGAGTLIIDNDQPYTGTTRVKDGVLAVGSPGSSGATLSGGGAVTVENGGTLGGYGTVAGPVTNQGTIAVADAVPAFAAGGSGNFRLSGGLTNSGTLQIAGEGVGNTLTVAGGYTGQNGVLILNTVLGADGSPSDRLVIDGGFAIGTTRIVINNVGGVGADTPGNGILVVDAINGATTASSAFKLDAPVFAGAYEYDLYRGARDGSATDDWFCAPARAARSIARKHRSTPRSLRRPSPTVAK